MAHITAGDIAPIGYAPESTYAVTDSGGLEYIADVREGGTITPTDNPNPHLAWRYKSNGQRTFDSADYVTQQQDAGYTAAVEYRDKVGWQNVLAWAGLSSSSAPLASIRSRTIQFGFRQDNGNTAYALTYKGCKTDQLKISADVPAGVVKFDETVMASYRDPDTTAFIAAPSTDTDVHAVQWVGGVTLGGTTVYPQSFSITIKNNLGRVQAYDSTLGKSKTAALVEGRQEIEAEFTLWLEDLTQMVANMDNDNTAQTVTLTLGTEAPFTLTGTALYMADGTNHGLVQDKQMQTVRLRLTNLYYASA